ncbi:thrombospondin type 3 repeat-containing protein [Pseudidiomarina salilacus]|uniref:thrombospondin type 3 repeat-containing protein n=1 Tax=Pseudidiomarina salilacus TaxID=3384452 RepID=UPI0039848414
MSVVRKLGFGLLTGLVSLGAAAQVVDETRVIITGEIVPAAIDAEYPDFPVLHGLKFKAMATELRGTPAVFDFPEFKLYEGSVVDMEIEFYDDNGDVVTPPFPTFFSVDTLPNLESTSTFYQFLQGFPEFYSLSMKSDDLVSREFDVDFIVQQIEESIIASRTGYPTAAIGPIVANFEFAINEVINQEGGLTVAYGITDYIDVDTDMDGVGDALDTCAFSDASTTVSFDGLESGVDNYTTDNGCTIMDLYAACEPQEEERYSRFSRFQPRYSGPSYCEKQVSYTLAEQGVITFQEARMLRDTLYLSKRSGRG